MRTLFVSALLILFSFISLNGLAQCVVDPTDSSAGLSPKLPCINPGVPFTFSQQIYVPADGPNGHGLIDSIVFAGINGLPQGITYSITPASHVLYALGHGCIWYSGTTTNPVGAYPLTVGGIIYTTTGPVFLNTVEKDTAYICNDSALSPGTANFFALNATGCVPLQTHFIDSSGNLPTGWFWKFPGGTPGTSTNQNPDIIYDSTGNYSVTLIVTRNGSADSITKSNFITVYPNPALTFQPTTASNSTATDATVLAIAANGTPPYTYSWNTGDSIQLLQNIGTGEYFVTVSDSHNCVRSDSVHVSFNSGVLESQRETTIKIFPNPAVDYMYIENKSNTEADINLVTIDAKEIRHLQVSANSIQLLDIQDLSAGVYILKMVDRNTGSATHVSFSKPAHLY